MNQRIILYERVQEEYDEFLQELLLLDEVAPFRIIYTKLRNCI